MILRTVLVIFLVLLSNVTMAQFWFGAKVGFHRTDFKYQNDETVFLLDGVEHVQNELYRPVSADYNYEFGGTVSYTATDKFAVYSELVYERIDKRVRSREGLFAIDNNFKYNYLSVPLLFRISTTREPIHYYFNLGPKISYLLKATAVIDNPDAFLRNGEDPIDGRIVFNESKNESLETLLLSMPNRIQYSLNIGGGILLDLSTGGRLMIDLRYSWGHSNLGSNTNSELFGFGENAAVSNQVLSFSIGYSIPYNPAELLKGSSTNDLLNTTKKKKKK